MSTKRQPSKQRRQTQNQKQRAALAVRREAAATGQAPAAKVGGDNRSSTTSTTSTTSSTASTSGSVLSRLRGATATGRTARAARTGGTARSLPVGHRAALSALLAAIAAALVGAVLFRVPVDRSGEAITTREELVAEWSLSASEVAREHPGASAAEVAESVDDWLPGGTKPFVQGFWPISAAVVLPVLGSGLGFRAVARRSSAKLVNRTMYVTLFGALLTSQLLLVFLPSVIAMAVAAFQVRKAEVAGQATVASDPRPDVIEADEADESTA